LEMAWRRSLMSSFLPGRSTPSFLSFFRFSSSLSSLPRQIWTQDSTCSTFN
jgi:hypothetical protein